MKIHFKDIELKVSKKSVNADFLTPVMVFSQIRSKYRYPFILESVRQNETIGRFSIIGFDPLVCFSSHGEDIEVEIGKKKQTFQGNIYDVLRALRSSLKFVDDISDLAGEISFIGYLSYDTIRHVEQIPDGNPDELGIPESLIILPGKLIVFDHILQKFDLIGISEVGDKENDVEEFFSELLILLSQPRLIGLEESFSGKKFGLQDVQSSMTRDDFEECIRTGIKNVYDGEVFQIVLSQRFKLPFNADPLNIYRVLRSQNPSPYHYFMSYTDFDLIGSSPEVLVRKEGRKVTVRPIAGTVPRGATPDEDIKLEQKLLSDPKELAEHHMLIDLARNDIGRVCEIGSVEVDEKLFIENYSYVKHIVSNVVGDIRDEYDALDLLKAVFPAGTLSGTPKVRAMELIDEIENLKRCTYGGTVIKWDFNDDLNSCIVIRSVLLKDGMANIQAGCGVVSDSVPEKEWEESLNKAKAVLSAVQYAREMKK